MSKSAIITFDRSLCRQMPLEKTRDLKFGWNRLWLLNLDDGGTAAFIEVRPGQDGDYALSQAALRYLTANLRKGTFAQAHIVFAERKKIAADRWSVVEVNQVPALEVEERLKGVTPFEGKQAGGSDYWWLTAKGELPGSSSGADEDAEIPGTDVLADENETT